MVVSIFHYGETYENMKSALSTDGSNFPRAKPNLSDQGALHRSGDL